MNERGQGLCLNCWVVTDGRAGIENQALGLAEAVGRLVPLDIVAKRIRVPLPWRVLPGALWGDPLARLSSEGALLRPPFPRLLIACGRLAAPVAAAIKAKNPATFVVQLQTPPGSLSHYDLVIPPEHDRLAGPNVFPIVGAPSRVTPARIAADGAVVASLPAIAALPSPRVAVLLGGPNRAYRFGAPEGANLGRSLARLAAGGAGLMLTSSRRTAPEALAAIRTALDAHPHFFWNGAAVEGVGNPYFGLLGAADFILVTADSVNMIAEAAMTGKTVAVMHLRKRIFRSDSKFARFRRSLESRGALRSFDGDLVAGDYTPIDETARAAAEVLKRMA